MSFFLNKFDKFYAAEPASKVMLAAALAVAYGEFVLEPDRILVAVPFDILVKSRLMPNLDTPENKARCEGALFLLYVSGQLSEFKDVWKKSRWGNLAYARENKGDTRIRIVTKKGAMNV